MILQAIKIETPEHVELLRQLRNLTSYGFSHFRGYITEDQQEIWWEEHKDHFEGWLYWHMMAQTFVGYGAVRQDSDGKWWNSIAVRPAHQGRGYGTMITHDVLARHHGPVFATVLKDNHAGIAMHHTDDWECIDGPDQRVLYFQSKWTCSDQA
jgi:GNAT superfamily N-acetyltransferase